jgi:hypothetical protein
MLHRRLALVVVALLLGRLAFAAPVLDERPPAPEEWGFRPFDRSASETNPPAFAWRPQKDAARYQLDIAADASFAKIQHHADDIQFACYCPPVTLMRGQWFWRFRLIDKSGQPSNWSQTRSVTIDKDAVVFPMPERKDLIARIPQTHPRLFVRPEQLPQLRERAKGDLQAEYNSLLADADKLLKNPPPTAEPPKYGPDAPRGSEKWRVIWWGNREYTIKVLNGAATLGFARLLSGNDAYGRAGKKLLMDAAAWDVKGATNYHYNDEAGMPYVYFFARAYTFLNDLLSEDEKANCREVIRFRGNEMYNHLNPRHIGSPYASHSNRAWHKLGEAGIAFLGEIPEAEDWVWFAMNVFYDVYPVWSDADGGWHEGVSYWNSYIERFTYFADVMRVAMDVDAFKKPFFSRIGYYPMYLQPPGTPGGGFGDLVADRKAEANRRLMTALAGQARNPYWQWYVQQLGGPQRETGYIGFVRGAVPQVEPKSPDDLPTSRAFHGIGQAYLNTNLTNASDNVEFGFKSSPFGTQSHGYDANNSFFLYAYGQRLLAPTGRRDLYGSDHHKNWMWETKSTNSILIDGQGQDPKHSAKSTGKITGFYTSDWLDYVSGDASASYGNRAKTVERHVVFLKPDAFVIYDIIDAEKPVTIDYLLHSPYPIKASSQSNIEIDNGTAQAHISIRWPTNLDVKVTDQFDVPPRERIKLKEYHVSAKAPPDDKHVEFVTVVRVGRSGQELSTEVSGGLICFGYIDIIFRKDRKEVRVASKVTSHEDLRPTFLVDRDVDANNPLLEIPPGGDAHFRKRP